MAYIGSDMHGDCGVLLMSAETKATVVATLLFVVILALIGGGVYVVKKVTCEQVAMKMKRPHDFAILQGCMIEWRPGEWLPLTAIRGFE